MIYLLILIAFVISIIFSMLIIPRILIVALTKRLFDIPDERKIHTGAVPRLGGISFAPIILFTLAFSTLGVLIPFFYYNVFGQVEHGRKIFMGDTGSLTLGYILAFLCIRYAVYNPEVTPYSTSAILVAFSTLIVPMFDVIRVMLIRFRSNKGLF